MEYIGNLPEPNDVLHHTIIPLFGILATTTTEKSGQCYFCFGEMEREELLAITMHCCGQNAHSQCFKTWTQCKTKDN